MQKENIKTFYLKYLTILAIPIALFFSINRLDAYTQKQNFTVINEHQSVIIQLPNTEYLELTSRNDIVTNYVDFSDKPFSTPTKIQKLSGLINTLALVDSHTEYVESGPLNKRTLKLKQASETHIEIELSATTVYRYVDGLVYNTQIDYTNKTAFTIDGSTVSFSDKGCSVYIEGEGITYSIFENDQSIILSKPYEPNISFILDMNISCKK